MGYESFPRAVPLRSAILNPGSSPFELPMSFLLVSPCNSRESPCVRPSIVLPHAIPIISECVVSRFVFRVFPRVPRVLRYKQRRVSH